MENKTKNFNKKQKFSIIIPTYNRANLLSRAIKSILSQTYQNFELIIINDGSTDDTEKVVSSFDSNKIIYIKHEKNKGAYAGVNTGLQSSRGEFIMLLGDDDELYLDALEFVSSKIEEHSLRGVKILWFDSIDLDTGKCASSNQKEEKFLSYGDLLCDSFQIDPVLVMEGNLLRQKMIEEKSWGDSGTIWLDFYHKDSKCLPLYVPKIICKSRSMYGRHMSHPETSIANIPGVILAQKLFLNQYEKELKNLCPKRCGQRLAILGLYQILNGEKKEGRNNVLQSLKFKFSLKYCFLFLFSYILSNNQIQYFYTIFFKLKRMDSYFLIPARKFLNRDKIHV